MPRSRGSCTRLTQLIDEDHVLAEGTFYRKDEDSSFSAARICECLGELQQPAEKFRYVAAEYQTITQHAAGCKSGQVFLSVPLLFRRIPISLDSIRARNVLNLPNLPKKCIESIILARSFIRYYDELMRIEWNLRSRSNTKVYISCRSLLS